jgi:carbonic anhydrase/acetyltransferase-like protein (isoleucine patch superfamily)
MMHELDGRQPRMASANYYVASGAQLIGDVRLGDWSSIWFNAVLRGDEDRIEIGDGSNIQDASVIHCDHGQPTIVGRRVTVGHCVLLHGCVIGDETLIGNGAQVLDGAQIGARCVVGAGALVTPGKSFPDDSVIMGAPARVIRATGDKELAMIARGHTSYRARAELYLARLKTLAGGV